MQRSCMWATWLTYLAQYGQNGCAMKLHSIRSCALTVGRNLRTFLPIVHHEGYVAPLPFGHRFPMQKFHHIFKSLVSDRIVQNMTEQVFLPTVPDWSTLALVHEEEYLRKLRGLTLSEQEVRKMGFPQTKEIVNRCLYETGGTILAGKLALEHGLATSTAGGTHHAFPGFASGFCVFNDLAVAAVLFLEKGLVKRVLIVDLDVHQGDGTASIFSTNESVFTFSMHCQQNFPLQKCQSDLDVSVNSGVKGEEYLKRLREHLPAVLDAFHPDLVLYDAGVDVHKADILGKLSLTDQCILERDLYVVDLVTRCHGVPCACVVGGGYSTDMEALAKRHTIIHHAASRVWERLRGT